MITASLSYVCMTTALDVELTFVPAPDDPAWTSPAYQAGLIAVQQELERLDPQTRSEALVMESAEGSFLLHGIFRVTVDKVLPLAGTAVASWLAGRQGRKIRLKVGDIEAEAGSVEEIDQLLLRAQDLQASKDRGRLL